MKIPTERALLTDLYQLAMLQAYFSSGMNEVAVFEFFARRLPGESNFLMAAGLEQVIDYLEELRFGDEDLAWLRSSGLFDEPLVESLKSFRFSGKRLGAPPALSAIHDHARSQVAALPASMKALAKAPLYDVKVSNPLRQLAQQVDERQRNQFLAAG